LGTDEPRNYEVALTLYPNPANQQLTVERSAVGGQQSAVRFSIFDLFGRDVKETGDISAFPYQIDISNLPDGIYILRVSDDSGNISSAKFIKTNDYQ